MCRAAVFAGLLSVLFCSAFAGDETKDTDQPVKVAGIIIGKEKEWLTVGEEEPVKCVVDPAACS